MLRIAVVVVMLVLVIGCSESTEMVEPPTPTCEQIDEYKRRCQCDGGGGLLFTIACLDDGEGPCAQYGTTCIDADAVQCSRSNYEEYPGLRDRCAAFCAMVPDDEDWGCGEFD